MPPLQRFVVALTGGLQDSKAIPDPGDLTELYNFALFRGRFALRAPATEVADLSTVAAGNDSDEVLDMETHLNKVFILGYESVGNIVKLYSMDLDGTGLVFKTNVWTGVTTTPVAKITSFSGGTAEAPQDRLYIADYNQDKATQYWIDSTTTLTAVSEDWNANDSNTGAAFSLMAPFQFHLWGTGFFEGLTSGTLRPELLRFSQPGLIEGTDPAGGTNPKEWFTLSHRSVGRRGDKIKAISYATGKMIVFQTRSTHAIFGYGSDSWATKQLSDTVGCVGPHAATATDADGLCFFWSHDGPYVSDGQSVRDIGQDIRQRILDVDSNDTVSAAYSPDDGMVYFIVPKTSDAADPYLYLAYDTENNKWVEGEWTTGVGNHISVNVAKTISSREILLAEGHTGDPTGLTANALCTLCNPTYLGPLGIELSWGNGDLALATETEIYRDTSSSPTTLIKTVGSGVTSYLDQDGLSHIQTYFYRLRHLRNGSLGNYTSDASDKTPMPWLSALPGDLTRWRISAITVPTGVTLGFNNPTLNAEIRIQRANSTATGRPDDTTLTFTDVTVLANQATGVLGYTDTSMTAGRYYVYRARLEETAEDPGGYSLSNRVQAGGAGTGGEPGETPTPGIAPTFTDQPNLNISDNGDGTVTVDTFVKTSDFVVGQDMIRRFIGWDGSYTVYTEIPTTTGRWRYIWSCPHPNGYTTVKVKWELWQNSSVLVDTHETTVSTPCTGIVF